MRHRILIEPAGRQIYAESGENLLSVLAANGYSVPAACGGRGTCGKCRVRLLSGAVRGTEADENGDILACRAFVCDDLVLALSKTEGRGTDLFSALPLQGEREGLGAILDVGTTTLALCLVDLSDGRVLKRTSALNPQGVLGADVLSRIQAWGEGKGALLQGLLLERVRAMLAEITPVGEQIAELTVAANTTMLHLLLGVDPTSIGVYPFLASFTESKRLRGEVLGLNVNDVVLLPSVSAYIGADVTAGALACELDKTDQTVLLIDVGTNGEIVLAHGGELHTASTAAGPALEGACIACGMGGVAGAIDSVRVENGVLSYTTVGGTAARGICGSGLIDLIACLLDEGLIDESGAYDADVDSPLAAHLVGDRFYLCEGVYLSQADIRQYQLAKAAIAAGILTLLDSCGVTPSDVARVCVAGGLGYHMNTESAARTGLLPRVIAERARAVGNTALAGARLCLLDGAYLDRAKALAARARVVELGGSAAFSEAYMMNMLLAEV